MEKLSEIWMEFNKHNYGLLNDGILEVIQEKKEWSFIPEELKCLLKANNGQKPDSEKELFGKLQNGKSKFNYHFLDFESIINTYNRIRNLKIPDIEDNEIPFAILTNEGFGFSINKTDLSINYISFNEYDYNGGTVHNKGIYKYSNNMIEFIENQIMLLEFE